MEKDYEGALYYLMTETAENNNNVIVPLAKKAISDLQELVDRDKPMNVVYGTLTSGLSGVICPKCKCCRVSRKVNVNIKFCEQCGQKLKY